MRNWLVTLIDGTLALLIVVALASIFLVRIVTVSGPSMEPNLQNGQHIFVWKYGQVRPLSVIVFNAHGVDTDAKSNPDYYVKRVIGMPGDTVSEHNGILKVNGKVINQSFISQQQQTVGSATDYNHNESWNIQSLAKHWSHNQHSVKVPKNSYFVLGDNRAVSNDSRYYSFVPKNKVLGTVTAIPGWDSTKQAAQNINERSAQWDTGQ